MADPGFLRGWGRQLPRGAPTYNFAKISQKLHEIERIWTPGGAARPKFYYVDPPLLLNSKSTDLDWYYSKNNWKLKLLIRDFLFTTFVKKPPGAQGVCA